jgi:mono/diheme cytochrome c family protein
MPTATNRYRRTLTSLRRHSKSPLRIFIAACFAVFTTTLVCGAPQPSPPIIHAYSSDSKRSGATVFHEKGCEHCHGVNGRGGELGPDLSTVGKHLKKQQIEHQIHDGGAAMPAFGDALQPDEIKDLVDFLHAKRKPPKNTALQTQ